MKKDIYSFGKCKLCGEEAALKNEYCAECHQKDENNLFTTLFGDIFGGNPYGL